MNKDLDLGELYREHKVGTSEIDKTKAFTCEEIQKMLESSTLDFDTKNELIGFISGMFQCIFNIINTDNFENTDQARLVNNPDFWNQGYNAVISIFQKRHACIPAEDYQKKVYDNRTEWTLDGKKHRLDDPTVEYDTGQREWFFNGLRHREDGPAIKYKDGSKEWWLNGQRHRTDGPAIESVNEYKGWYLNGQLHRTDGPAIEYANGQKEWWLNDKQYYTEAAFNKKLLENKG